MLTPELWPRISEAARLRIENKLIREVEQGEITASGKASGSLGTWANRYGSRFALRSNLASVLLNKLEDVDEDDRRYVVSYFFSRLPEILTEEGEITRATRAIASAIRGEDPEIRSSTISYIKSFPNSWQEILAESLKDLASSTSPAVILNDGSPFLEDYSSSEITDDDIPF